MSIICIPNEILHYIFIKLSNDKLINVINSNSKLLLFKYIFNNNIKQKYLLIFKKNKNTSIILQNIKNKLKNTITSTFYNDINTYSIYNFKESIKWGENRFLDEEFIDCFSYNTIFWNIDEAKLLYDVFDISFILNSYYLN